MSRVTEVVRLHRPDAAKKHLYLDVLEMRWGREERSAATTPPFHRDSGEEGSEERGTNEPHAAPTHEHLSDILHEKNKGGFLRSSWNKLCFYVFFFLLEFETSYCILAFIRKTQI